MSHSINGGVSYRYYKYFQNYQPILKRLHKVVLSSLGHGQDQTCNWSGAATATIILPLIISTFYDSITRQMKWYCNHSNSCINLKHTKLPVNRRGCHGSWIYNYLCNQCPSPLKLWVQTLLMARSQCTRYNIMW
jgi:hypothetical protein